VRTLPALAALLVLVAAGATADQVTQTAPAQPGAATEPGAASQPGAATQPAGPAAPARPAPSGPSPPGATRYVIEQLVVSVNSAADGSGTRVGILKSGDKVELLERSGEAAHIRLGSGRDGWVRLSYLTEAEPLRVQLAARTAEVATLRQQLQALSAAPAAAAPVAAAPAAAEAPASEASLEVGGSDDAGDSHGVAWGWLLGTAVVSLAAGFAVGWLVLDARVRRRYGGLRIY
jgi:hypothetical protein